MTTRPRKEGPKLRPSEAADCRGSRRPDPQLGEASVTGGYGDTRFGVWAGVLCPTTSCPAVGGVSNWMPFLSHPAIASDHASCIFFL